MLVSCARILPVVFALLATVASEPAAARPPIAKQPVVHEVTGSGSGSFEAVLKRHKVPAEIRDVAVRSFQLDPDFPKKLPKDSRFQLVYEETPALLDAGEPRRVLRSVWVMAGERLFDLYRYSWRGNAPVYFNQNGRSLRELVLRLPVDDARISSKFGWREHPILQKKKFHYGLDLAAPPGTPVFAAADGVVAMSGRNGNYGNYVRIEHAPHIATGYAHLSGIVSTLTPGTRVKQGEMIGFVGMTGLATGPHLCFQLLDGKKLLNPLTTHPMIEEDILEQLVTNPGQALPVATIGDLQ